MPVRARTGWQLAVLCAVPFVMVLGNSMLIPVLPGMRAALGLSPAQSALVITAFSIPAGLTIFLAGYLADHLGRKRVMAPALLLYSAGGVICFVAAMTMGAKAFSVILLGRVIQGIGAAGTAPVAMAMVGDMFQSTERAKGLGLLESANAFGKVLSPLLGAALGILGWAYVFAGYAAVAAPVAGLVWWATREPQTKKAQGGGRAYFQAVWQAFRAKAGPLSACFAAGTVVLFVLFGVLFFLSETLEQKYGLDGIPKGAALAIPLLVMCGTAYWTGARLGKEPRWLKPAVVAGLALGTAGMVLVPLLGGTRVKGTAGDVLFFGGMVLLGLGSGLVLPALNTLITSAVSEEKRGMVTSAYGAVRFFGVALGPPLFGLLLNAGPAVPFWTSAALLAAAGAVAALAIRPADLVGDTPAAGQQRAPEKRQAAAQTAIPARTPAATPAAPAAATVQAGGPGTGQNEVPPWEPPVTYPGPEPPRS